MSEKDRQFHRTTHRAIPHQDNNHMALDLCLKKETSTANMSDSGPSQFLENILPSILWLYLHISDTES